MLETPFLEILIRHLFWHFHLGPIDHLKWAKIGIRSHSLFVVGVPRRGCLIKKDHLLGDKEVPPCWGSFASPGTPAKAEGVGSLLLTLLTIAKALSFKIGSALLEGALETSVLSLASLIVRS